MYPRSSLLLALLPLVQFSVGQPLLQVSKVFYFDQLPDNVTSDFPPELDDAKSQLYIRKDVVELEDASLSCDLKGTFELGFENASVYELDIAGYEIIGHPIVVPLNYTQAEGCPDLKNHTIFGPRDSVPEDVLAELNDDEDYAVFIPLSINALEDGILTVSAIWADYHSIFGSVGDAPEGLEFFNIGIYPWTELSGQSDKVKRVNGGNNFLALAGDVAEFALDNIWSSTGGD